MSPPSRAAVRGAARALGLLPGPPSIEELHAAGRLGLVWARSVPGGWEAIPSMLLEDTVDQLRHERGVGGALVVAVLDAVARGAAP